MLTKRDKEIIRNIERFRVMDRDSIAELHFSNLKEPCKACNNVLLRLVRDNHIERSTKFTPYVYMTSDSQIKKTSQKIQHYLAILETYKEIIKTGVTEGFLVEPRFGNKGTVEPDIFLRYRGTSFFIEIQRTVYSEKQMNEKIDRYVELFHQNTLDKFPHVLIITDTHYSVGEKLPFKVFQASSFTAFLNSLKPSKPIEQRPKNEIRLSI